MQNTKKSRNQSQKADAPAEARKLPKYILTLLKAAREVEAKSHIDLEANEYHVDVLAMAQLCGALGSRRWEAAS